LWLSQPLPSLEQPLCQGDAAEGGSITISFDFREVALKILRIPLPGKPPHPGRDSFFVKDESSPHEQHAGITDHFF
jgi:hypothetical protein